jgi:hypothetical protein
MEEPGVIWQDISEWGIRYRIREILDRGTPERRYVFEHSPGGDSLWTPKDIPAIVIETLVRLVKADKGALPDHGLVLEKIMLQGAAKLAAVLGVEVKNVGDLASIYAEAAKRLAAAKASKDG